MKNSIFLFGFCLFFMGANAQTPQQILKALQGVVFSAHEYTDGSEKIFMDATHTTSTRWIGDTLEITQVHDPGSYEESTRWLKMWVQDGGIRGLENHHSTRHGEDAEHIQKLRNGMWSEGFVVPFPWKTEWKYVSDLGDNFELIKTAQAAPFLFEEEEFQKHTRLWLYIPRVF